MLIQNALFNHTSLPVLGKSLDAAAMRAKAIAGNIANVGTPGYQRIEVAFEEALRQALKPNPQANTAEAGEGLKSDRLSIRPELAQVEPVAYRPIDLTRPSGVNNVDIDMEMAKLAENQIAFQLGVRLVQDRRGAIEQAIRGQAG